MHKRMISVLLCFGILFCMMTPGAPISATENAQLRVTADKAEANPGDTITYTLTLGPVSDLGTIQMDITIPEGLTYVANSGKLAAGLAHTLGFDVIDWTEETKRITGAASASDYSSQQETVLATFQCVVNEDYIGSSEVSLSNLEFYSCQTWKDHTSNYTVVPAVVEVVEKVIPVTGVTIEKAVSLKTGQSKVICYTVIPREATDKGVWFRSDHPEYVTVDATTGEVTAVKKGTAIITIETIDGQYTDTCVVTVSCSHANQFFTSAKESDCAHKGWDAYVTCRDCGQLLSSDGITEIFEIPYRPFSATHVGGTATCTARAICSVCGAAYGKFAPHDFSSEVKSEEALKAAGNCRDHAVYYYSCTVCGLVERNDDHTFLGEKTEEHEWSQWRDAALGIEERSCGVCDAVEKRQKAPEYDVNGDGSIDQADLSLLMSFLVGNTEADKPIDFDFDGALTVYDGVLLMQHLAE